MTIRPAQVIGFELLLLTAMALSQSDSRSTLQDAYRAAAADWSAGPCRNLCSISWVPSLTIAFYALLLLWGLALLAGLRWHDGQRALQRSSRSWRRWRRCCGRRSASGRSARRAARPCYHRTANRTSHHR